MEHPGALQAPRMGLAIAGLMLGIVAFLGSLFVIGALLGLIGLLCSLWHIRQKRGLNGMAWWGLGLSAAGVVVGIAMGFVYYHFVSAEMKRASTAPHAFDQWIGYEAPDMTLKLLDGTSIRLRELKGKRVVLDFWATWCAPCIGEMPHFTRLYGESSREDLVLIGISREDEAAVRSFVAKKGIKFPIAVSGNLPSPYKDIASIPTTFFIDRKGVVQSVVIGAQGYHAIKKHALTADFERPRRPVGDPWLGTWKLNPAKSMPPPAVAADITETLVAFRAMDPDTYEIAATQVRTDGSRIVTWKCTVPKSGGMQTYQHGAPEGGIAVLKTVVDAHTQNLTFIKEGRQTALATIMLGSDGKSYRYATKSQDMAGPPSDNFEIYEKQ